MIPVSYSEVSWGGGPLSGFYITVPLPPPPFLASILPVPWWPLMTEQRVGPHPNLLAAPFLFRRYYYEFAC